MTTAIREDVKKRVKKNEKPADFDETTDSF